MARFFWTWTTDTAGVRNSHYIERGEKCEMSIFSTLLVPISWAFREYELRLIGRGYSTGKLMLKDKNPN